MGVSIRCSSSLCSCIFIFKCSSVRTRRTTWKYLLLPLNCISCIWPYAHWHNGNGKRVVTASVSLAARGTICSLLVLSGLHQTSACIGQYVARIGFQFDIQINCIQQCFCTEYSNCNVFTIHCVVLSYPCVGELVCNSVQCLFMKTNRIEFYPNE